LGLVELPVLLSHHAFTDLSEGLGVLLLKGDFDVPGCQLALAPQCGTMQHDNMALT